MNNDIIKLSIPKKPDYINIVRLTISGVANSMGLDIDTIDDIKVSVGEACLNSLCSAKQEEISLIFTIDEEKIVIDVNNVSEEILDMDEKRERELGILIIKSLMDEVIFNELGIKMIKYIEDDING